MKRAILILSALALLLGSVGQVKASLIGPTLVPPYNYGGDSATSVLVTYPSYAFPGAGIVDAFQSYNQADPAGYWAPGQNFTALQLRANGVSTYLVINEQTFTTVNVQGVVAYNLSSPWTVQAGDIYAHYGQGIPLDIPAVFNAADPLYYPPTHQPAVGETITLGGPDYPVYSQSRDYYLDANFTAVPEPATLTMLGIGIASMAGYGWRRRKQQVAYA